MTQEEKELRLVDLCARLPYGVICQVDDGAAGLNDGKLVEIDISKEHVIFDADYYWDAYIDDVKAYLRPLSSMTEEEKLELYRYYCKEVADSLNNSNLTWELRCCVSDSFGTDWLNVHHFDYRGLIPKGLALVAPEGMYKHFGDMDMVVTSVKHKNKL